MYEYSKYHTYIYVVETSYIYIDMYIYALYLVSF